MTPYSDIVRNRITELAGVFGMKLCVDDFTCPSTSFAEHLHLKAIINTERDTPPMIVMADGSGPYGGPYHPDAPHLCIAEPTDLFFGHEFSQLWQEDTGKVIMASDCTTAD